MAHRAVVVLVWAALVSCAAPRMNERIALTDAAFVGYDLEAAVEKLRSLGFQSMAIHHGGPTREDFPTLALDRSDDEEKARTRRIMSRVKHVSIHQNGETDWKAWIDGAAFSGARIVTFHFRPRESVEDQVRFFREAGDYAREKGVRIGIENVRGSWEKYQEVIRRVRHPRVGVIIDLGHVPMFDDISPIKDDAEKARRSNDRLEEMIRRYKDRLWHMHVHNSRPSEGWRDHYGDLDGPIDVARVIRTLNEVGYTGMIVLELHRQNETLEQKAKFGWYVSELLGE